MPARARQDKRVVDEIFYKAGREAVYRPKAPLQYFDVYHGCDFSITVRSLLH